MGYGLIRRRNVQARRRRQILRGLLVLSVFLGLLIHWAEPKRGTSLPAEARQIQVSPLQKPADSPSIRPILARLTRDAELLERPVVALQNRPIRPLSAETARVDLFLKPPRAQASPPAAGAKVSTVRFPWAVPPAEPPARQAPPPVPRIEDFLVPVVLEATIPEAVALFNRRMERILATMERPELARRYSEEELNRMLIQPIQARHSGSIRRISAAIRPDGLQISGALGLGAAEVPVEARMEVQVVHDRVHVVLQRLAVDGRPMDPLLCAAIERRVNAAIDQERFPLRVKELVLGHGWAWVALETTG